MLSSSSTALAVIRADRVLTTVTAPDIPDPVGLVSTLVGAGLRAVELTYSTLGVLEAVATAATVADAALGVGGITTREQAEGAIEVGARFLVTPTVRPEIVEVAVAHTIPVIMGAYTPTEVAAAAELGAAAVKIFSARALGPDYVEDLLGPFPHLFLIPAGGVTARNARAYLRAGAIAVGVDTEVITALDVETANWSHVRSRTTRFLRSLV
ncbi:bifunctional 4-hydroxy-2-oxoglutarate aldolase/2-dehydro-3-deoxy-phosphogluconate aldolase [Nocardia lasii]|uniref:Bifunctional 4-hydroxy-2-oxoglutarate aldolase/2-dehydro-3-deoxy-phosphogluconate aldolase n=1 Tax=Nocardia lasii TaxID=1616107 RepID=A0ABW1JY31_9NOCA